MNMKRILSAALVLAMLVGLVPGAGMTAEATDDESTTITESSQTNTATMTVSVTVPEKPDVPYLDWDGSEKKLVEKTGDDACEDYNYVLSTDTAWGEAGGPTWYVASGTVTVEDRVTVSGTVNLILKDSATLTASRGITTTGATLNIFAQSTGDNMGALIADAEDESNAAGIGGGYYGAGGTVNIYGGAITAIGAGDAAGIGGGMGGNGGTTAIYGGIVNANGGSFGAGIGGGAGGNGGTTTIYGGTVTATGGANSAGIGGGNGGNGGTASITGGTVTVICGSYAQALKLSAAPTVTGMEIKAGENADTAQEVTPDAFGNSYSTYKWVQLKPLHNHTLTNYAVSGDTITAECTADNCPLPEADGKHIATLTIAPKSDGTATLTGGADFGRTDADIDYTQNGQETTADAIKSNTEAAFYEAGITVGGVTAKVNYGVNAVKKAEGYDAATANGDFDVPKTAAIDATVTINTTPDAGYELESLTVTKAGSGTVNVTKAGNSGTFTMPSEAVTVDATFCAIDYTVTVSETTNGAVTASKTSDAHVGDEITLTVTPAERYAVGVITVKDASNHDVTVTNRAFTMPASNVTVDVTFAEQTTYTIFYRASGEPASVLVRLSDSGDGVAMAPSAKLGGIDCWAIQVEAKKDIIKLPVAFKVGDGEWSELNTDQSVVKDIPDNLDAGSAAVIEGEAKAFVVAFTWGDLTQVGETDSYLPADNSTKHFLVTNNTASVSVTPPTKKGYTFRGWEYSAGQNVYTTGTSESVSLANVSETTVFSALWELNTCNVTYNLNGGSGNAPDAKVNYGGKATAPANPTRGGYAFVRWVVAESATEKIGDEEVRLSAGTVFDFNNTEIINDLKLKAEWKHVHSYVCLPLNHAAFGNAFSKYVEAGYGNYMHIRICTSMDDYCAEAHSFGSNGKCACGATKPTPTVTLNKQIGNETATEMQVKLNSVVAVAAPAKKGADTFSGWQYHDGAKWRALSTSTVAAFVIPSDLQVKAVYEGSKAELNIESFKYNNNIAFYFSYKVPDGYTVLDGGILFGNNSHLRYMLAKTPKESMDLSISGAVQYFAPIPSIVEAPVYYEVAKDNAVAKFGAANVATKMFREEALNVSGRSNPIFKKVSSLGKAGTAAIAINPSADNIYYYGMGYVICRAPNKQLVAFKTDAIAATRGEPNRSAKAVINVN